ncbi:hypothetical protein [Brevundimonas sp. M20]|uniref:hypothetical protein n=1 Tax=Brevundimonas sp. M20 TaxID=2591463 RepID=UPI0011478739|nr:hypothetical protein [Brevundimonas sp. M20]QDH72582.1 hypothetical protein FKQ52_03535 [Brevundimonas sp. M20]
MTHSPKIPKEQRSFADRGGRSMDEAVNADRRDLATGAQSGQPGDSDVNLETQGRFGNLRQNLTTHWKVQQR